MADIERALSTLVASTGNYLLPEVVDPGIRDYIAKENVLLNAITRIPWGTQTYWIRRRVGVGTASWEPDGGALPAATNSTYSREFKTVKYLYTRGEVTGPMIAASGNVVNALQEEIRVSARVIAEKLATDIVTGDGSPAEEIVGMIAQIYAGAPGDYGGTLDYSGSQLVTAYLDEAIEGTRDECNLIITSRKMRRKINSILSSLQRFNNEVNIPGGFRVQSWDGIPIITDLHWENYSQILFVNTRDCRLLVNQDFTYEPLAKTKDSVDYMIKGYFGFALEGRPVLLKVASV
jgi:hypothetical protein